MTLPPSPAKHLRLAVVTGYFPSITEDFIRRHIEDLVPDAVHLYDWPVTWRGQSVLGLPRRILHKLRRELQGRPLQDELTDAYTRVFRRQRVNVVLAEYGDVGAAVLPACLACRIPLVVHFHGYDASNREHLAKYREAYDRLFEHAAAVIAVSRAMERKLLALGARRDRLHYNPCGVNTALFQGADPAGTGPAFLAVGRFVEKKAPHLTLEAFARVATASPQASLTMIGDGPLLEGCRELALSFGIAERVRFLGAAGQDTVQREMRVARCFVQHSIVAPSGDSEGTPVAVLEASASGLPVVSTRHGGIPDAVVEGVSGFLVDEGDVEGMAERMLRLAADPALAAHLGSAGRRWIGGHFEASARLESLRAIVSASAAAGGPAP